MLTVVRFSENQLKSARDDSLLAGGLWYPLKVLNGAQLIRSNTSERFCKHNIISSLFHRSLFSILVYHISSPFFRRQASSLLDIRFFEASHRDGVTNFGTFEPLNLKILVKSQRNIDKYSTTFSLDCISNDRWSTDERQRCAGC